MDPSYGAQPDDPTALDQEELLRQLRQPAASPVSGAAGMQYPTATGPSGPGRGAATAGGALSGASAGATIGSVVPGVGTAIGAGIGALGGAITGARRNDTKNAREDFAKSLGASDSTALWQQLGDKLPADQANELRDRALNKIGKHDTAGNQQWESDVQYALGHAPDKTATAPATPAADPAAATPASPVAPIAPPAGTAKTRLMEGDPAKLADPSHAAKSPKYDFLQLAQQNKYDYTQMPDMLKELQGGANGRLWQGWTADGKGNFVFTGDPSQLAPEWNGVRRVDAVGAYGNLANGGQAAGWRWGADDPNAAAAGGPAAGGGSGSGMPSSGQPSLTPTDSNFYNELQKKLVGILGGPEAFDREALLQQLSGK